MSGGARRFRLGAVLAATVLPVVLVAGGCSSDDTDNAAFCADISAVQSDLDSIKTIDISVSNAAELGTAIEQLGTDVNSLATSTSDTANDEVDALGDAMKDLSKSVSNLVGSGTVDDVSTAFANVTTAFDSVQSSVDCS